MSTSEARHVMPAPIPIPKPPPEAPQIPGLAPPWERNQTTQPSHDQTIRSGAAGPSSAGGNQMVAPTRKYRRRTAKNLLLEILEKDKVDRKEAEIRKEEERKKEEERRAKGIVNRMLSLIIKE
ncbi:uncharacterized protein MELLADRAFT_108334 [Melampsora larici-populina 98AG31]|uniref:Uncharacterized protein n=1 Tax=Melampsora larici-populina (strain 98AG31 / pathotype 3-4-7) TaxID=747676 RepID=F4RSS2_MELLP|nr:uncharacterized protein MELLADRAFT_108334 [Melampsora larici-populina 98AG31]EGG04559.1 hypothetical protein MELLADRAFT_108334 [Melampsora larici-populina 98AG31]